MQLLHIVYHILYYTTCTGIAFIISKLHDFYCCCCCACTDGGDVVQFTTMDNLEGKTIVFLWTAVEEQRPPLSLQVVLCAMTFGGEAAGFARK